MSWSAQSKWIWVEENKSEDYYGEFFTTFETNEKSAKIYISADSNYTLFLNGKFVNSGQYPDFPHFKVYDELDLSDYCVKGENKLAVIVWYYGVSNMSYCVGNAALRFEVLSGTSLLAYSDSHVVSRQSRAYQSGMKQEITKQLGFSFLYCADLEDDWKNGMLSHFSDSFVVNQNLPLHKRPVKKLEIKPIKDSHLIKSNENYYLFDLGTQEVGYLTLKVFSAKQQTLTICYGEHIADGSVRRKIGIRDFSVQIRVKSGVTEYTNYFRRLGLRYVEVHSEHPLDIEYVSVLPCVYPLEKVDKHFQDPLLQQIYDTSVRTLELCIHDHYEDSPWREQGLYTMDSRNQMLCGYFAFRESDFQRANLHLISQDCREDGLLSICFPTNTELTIPSFSLFYFIAVYEYLLYTKDQSLIVEIMPKLTSIIKVFLNRMEQGLVKSFEGKNYWNFYEWSEGLRGSNPEKTREPEAALNCLLSLALQALQKICDIIGQAADYTKTAAVLNENIHKTFFNRESGLVANNPEQNTFSELVNSLAILCGAVTGRESQHICQVLAGSNSLTKISLSMACFKYDALLSLDKNTYKPFVLNDIKRAYKPMLDSGATSFWETEAGESDFDGAGSLCHGWSATPVYYYHVLME